MRGTELVKEIQKLPPKYQRLPVLGLQEMADDLGHDIWRLELVNCDDGECSEDLEPGDSGINAILIRFE